MKGKKLAQLIGGLCLISALVLAAFFMLNMKEDDREDAKNKTKNTEVQNILSKDIDRNYPATVREVVRLFSRISKCYHNETISKEEFKSLVEVQRMLFDEEFLEKNPLDTFTNNLAAEIDAAKAKEYKMAMYRVQKQSSVVTWKDGDNSFASIIASYTMSTKGEGYSRTFEEFLLREDENKRWKIVGWRLTDPIEIEE